MSRQHHQPANLAFLLLGGLLFLAIVLAVLALETGCAGSLPPPVAASAETAPEPATGPPGSLSDPFAFPPPDPYGFPPAEVPRGLAVLHFAFDSASLQPDADALLAPLAGLSWFVTIQVTGHADPVGTEVYNLDLGLRRARAVAWRLTILGAQSGALVVVSRGESQPQSTHALSRRVIVEAQ